MSQKCYGILGSTAVTFVWKECENPEKFSRLVLVHAGEPVYVFETYITERDRSGMAAWLGAIKEGAQEGEEEKNFFDRNRSWKELLLPSWPKKLVFEIILYSI